MNIADIKKLEAGATVPSVTGTVSDVKNRRQVNGRKGVTTVQDIKLQEGNDWITLIMWGRDDLSNLRGKEIKVANDRGLLVKEESFQGKSGKTVTMKKLQVGEHASITSPGWGTPDEPQQAKFTGTSGSAPMQTNLRPTPDEHGVKERLNRMANLYLDCILAAEYVTANKALTADHYQACVASLFITATREGLHDKMATGKFNMPAEEPEPEEAPPQQRTPNGGMAFPPDSDVDDDVPF